MPLPHLSNQGKQNWPFFLLFPQRTGARAADGEGCDERDGSAQQKGFVSPQRDFVSLRLLALPWHAHKQQHLYIYCFRLAIKCCVKDRTTLMSWEEAAQKFLTL